MTEVAAGPRAARLLLPGADPSLRGHIDRFGGLPWDRDLISEVDRAGLRGRGGAAFPTAVKLAAIAGRRRPLVVANATEGEPLSAKDKLLVMTAPHLVLDGVALVAAAIGACEAVVCVDRTATRVLSAVDRALAERAAAGLDRAQVTIAATPSRYLVGEETALVHWLDGGEAKPTMVPPRPFERGVAGRPTLVQNVETLAHLALIARFGASWFRTAGTEHDPGTVLVTISGGVAQPGVYEIEHGAGMLATLRAAGLPDGPPQPVLVGGYFGAWVGADDVERADLGPAALRSVGASLGSGALWVLPPRVCGLAETARVARWFAEQSAGQCGPCTNGLPAIAAVLDAVVAGRGGPEAVEHVHHYAALVAGRGACHHPDGAARLVRSAITVFAEEIDRHARRGPCPGSGARALPVPRGGSWR